MSKVEWRKVDNIILGKEDETDCWFPCIITQLGKKKVTVDWIGYPGSTSSKLERSLTAPFKQLKGKGQRNAAFVTAKVCLGKRV